MKTTEELKQLKRAFDSIMIAPTVGTHTYREIEDTAFSFDFEGEIYKLTLSKKNNGKTKIQKRK